MEGAQAGTVAPGARVRAPTGGRATSWHCSVLTETHPRTSGSQAAAEACACVAVAVHVPLALLAPLPATGLTASACCMLQVRPA